MSGMAPDRVPTLTEVVSWPVVEAPQPVAEAPPPTEPPVLPPPPAAHLQLNEAELTRQILADVQRQIDLMLEYRLREALAPVLARATDNLVRESRSELASTLRDVVARAVAQELARHRSR